MSAPKFRPMTFGVTRVVMRDGAPGTRYMQADQPLRVVLIGTYRTDELHERHPFLALLAELGRTGQVQRLELVPFTPGGSYSPALE